MYSKSLFIGFIFILSIFLQNSAYSIPNPNCSLSSSLQINNLLFRKWTCTLTRPDGSSVTYIRRTVDLIVGDIYISIGETTEQIPPIINGLEDNNIYESLVDIFPNPTVNLLNISNNFSSEINIQLFNSNMNIISEFQVLNNTKIQINFSEYANGTYYFMINNHENKEILFKKIIKLN